MRVDWFLLGSTAGGRMWDSHDELRSGTAKIWYNDLFLRGRGILTTPPWRGTFAPWPSVLTVANSDVDTIMAVDVSIINSKSIPGEDPGFRKGCSSGGLGDFVPEAVDFLQIVLQWSTERKHDNISSTSHYRRRLYTVRGRSEGFGPNHRTPWIRQWLL